MRHKITWLSPKWVPRVHRNRTLGTWIGGPLQVGQSRLCWRRGQLLHGACIHLTFKGALTGEQHWWAVEAHQAAQRALQGVPGRLLYRKILSSPSLVAPLLTPLDKAVLISTTDQKLHHRGYMTGEALDFFLFLLLNIFCLTFSINLPAYLTGNTLVSSGGTGKEQGAFASRPR